MTYCEFCKHLFLFDPYDPEYESWGAYCELNKEGFPFYCTEYEPLNVSELEGHETPFYINVKINDIYKVTRIWLNNKEVSELKNRLTNSNISIIKDLLKRLQYEIYKILYENTSNFKSDIVANEIKKVVN